MLGAVLAPSLRAHQGCTTFPAAPPAAKHNLLCPEGKLWPPVVVGCSSSSCWPLLPFCCHTWPVVSAHGTTVAPQTPYRGQQSSTGCLCLFCKSPQKKKFQCLQLPFRERSVETRGDSVPKPHHELNCCDVRTKDLGTRHSYFRGRQGNRIIRCPACRDLENQMLMALRLPLYKVTVLPYPSQVFLPHFWGCGLMVSAGEHHQFKVLHLPGPLPSFSLVLAQHTTPLTVLIQTCW